MYGGGYNVQPQQFQPVEPPKKERLRVIMTTEERYLLIYSYF
jgi:hypothetical protein